jgi:hypothetical protein
VRARLDVAVQDALHVAVAALNHLWSSGEGGVWLVRRLEVEIAVNMRWEAEDLVRSCAMQLARRLVHTLRDDGEHVSDKDVIHFKSQAEYLACFLSDLEASDAWGRWYYGPYQGLKMLSTSQAIHTALAAHPGVGLQALTLLSTPKLFGVLRAMSRNDAMRTLQGLSNGDTQRTANITHCLEAARIAWIEWGGELSIDVGGEANTSLALYALVCKRDSTLASATLGNVVAALTRLALRLRIGQNSYGLLAALEGHDRSRLYLAAGPGDAEVLSPLLDAPTGWVRLMAASIATGMGGGASEGTGAGMYTEPIFKATRLGGAFLLMPLLDRLPLDELTEGWPQPGAVGENKGLAAAQLLRFTLLACCLGQERAEAAFLDPALRELMGIHPAVMPPDVGRWLIKVGPARLDNLLEALRVWWLDNGAIAGKSLFLVRVPRRVPWQDRPVAILLDAERGLWLSTNGLDDKQARAVRHLKMALGCADASATIYSEPGLTQALRSARPDLHIVEMAPLNISNGGVVGSAEVAESDAADTFARLDRVPFDLSYLHIPRAWRVPRSARLRLAVVAMGVLRDFAWRLPGFARSGLPYLFANFLDMHASLEYGPDKHIISLGRPPLNLVLNMTGMARGLVELDWLDRPLALYQE